MHAADVGHWLWELGEAGVRLQQLGALEGAAGNMSLFLPLATPGLDMLVADRFPRESRLDLPGAAQLPLGVLLISGTGCRLRDAATRPEAVFCAIVVAGDGRAWLHRAPGHDVRPTSEIDTHVGIHEALLAGVPTVHAVIHAQPMRLTYLSHVAAYQDEALFNRRLRRWQPETIVAFPEGISVLPFEVPGTPAQGRATAEAMRRHRLVVWAKHGVVARSPLGPLAAADLIDYAEAAAGYELLDLQLGGRAPGLTDAELLDIAARFGVPAVSFLDVRESPEHEGSGS